MLSRKEKGKLGEELALQYFLNQGYKLVCQNYTIWGGEIDLILQNETTWIIVEVKVVDGVDDISDYITSSKLSAVKRTIRWFFLETQQGDLELQLAVVCVRGNKIYQVYRYET